MKRNHPSGAQKRKLKRDRDSADQRGKITLIDLGWISQPSSSRNEIVEHSLTTEISFENAQQVNEDEALPQPRTDTEELFVAKILPYEICEAELPAQHEGSEAVEETTSSPLQPEDNLPGLRVENDDDIEHLAEAARDPGAWTTREEIVKNRDLIVLQGVPSMPTAFPRDSCGRPFPVIVLYKEQPNSVKVPRDWLVWSDSVGGLFCFSCCLFQSDRQSESASKLCKFGVGVRGNWHKLHEKLRNHEKSAAHVEAYLAWKDCLTSLKKATGIDKEVVKQVNKESEKWREILRCCLDGALFLAGRNLAFRGSSSHVGEHGNGNFIGVLELIGRHNQTLKYHLDEVVKYQQRGERMQAHYLSWRTQNEFLELCGNSVRKAVVDEIIKAQYYSISVDSTPDTSHTEEVTFLFRFVNQSSDGNWEVFERFLKLVDFEKKKGKDISGLIFEVLKENNLEIMLCRSQAYDNASNMSGCYKGVQAEILKVNSCALYSPCGAHSLNLCGVNAAQACLAIKSYFGNIQKLYNLFSCSPARWKVLRENASVSLHSLSDTRWSARIDAVKPLLKDYRGILKSLELLQELDLPSEAHADADTLYNWMSSFHFVLLSTFWYKTLQAIDDRNKLLQKASLSIEVEVRECRNLLQDIVTLRTNWNQLVSEAKLVATQLGLESQLKTKALHKRKTFYGEPKNTEHLHETAEDKFKVEVFLATLDRISMEIKERFQAANNICDLFSFLWDQEVTNMDLIHRKTKSLAQAYPRDLNEEDLVEEMRLFVKTRENFLQSKLCSPLKLLNKIYEHSLETLFPQICISLRMFLCLPVSVASAERSFSKMSLVKNHLCSTMGQERLNHLLILSVEHKLAQNLNYDNLIDEFAMRKARKSVF